MKILTVLVLCIIGYVNAYTIFPLPGQSAGVNPKFSGFTQQTTKSPQLNSRLGSSEPRPFQSQISKIPEVNIGNVGRPSNTAQSVVPSSQPTKSVEILNSATNQASYLKIVTPTSFSNNHQNFVPTKPFAATEHPVNDLLPPREDSRPVSTNTATYPRPTTPTVPQRPIVEVPFNDLLPPKNK